MVAGKWVKRYLKDLVRGCSGFYEISSKIDRMNRDLQTRFEQLAQKQLLTACPDGVSPRNIAEGVIALQQLVADLPACIQSLRDDSVTDRLVEIQASLATLQEALRTFNQTAKSGQIATSGQEPLVARRQRIRDELSHNGLFVVGHARTGTSILQTALNTSSDIFMLGEANLHQNHHRSGFARWYRAMHTSFDNPPSKCTSCPDPDGPEGDAWDVLMTLRRQYRLVGDKMAFRPRRLGYDFHAGFRFLQDYFAGAHIIGTLRNPRDVLGSNALMFQPDDLDEYVVSYLECLALQIDLVCSFDYATILVHESINPDTFIDLGHWLGCDLRNAYARCYEPQFLGPRHGHPDGLRTNLLELAETYYHRLCKQFETAPCGDPSMIELARIRQNLRIDILNLQAREQSEHLSLMEAAN